MADKLKQVMGRMQCEMTSRFADKPMHPDQHDLDALEKRLGYGIPADYREFLLTYGGCRIVGAASFPVTRKNGLSAEGNLTYLYGVFAGSLDLLTMYELYTTVWDMPKWLLPIGCNSANDLVCVALGGQNVGEILYWSSEEDPGWTSRIAPSFSDFIDLLVFHDVT